MVNCKVNEGFPWLHLCLSGSAILGMLSQKLIQVDLVGIAGMYVDLGLQSLIGCEVMQHELPNSAHPMVPTQQSTAPRHSYYWLTDSLHNSAPN